MVYGCSVTVQRRRQSENLLPLFGQPNWDNQQNWDDNDGDYSLDDDDYNGSDDDDDGDEDYNDDDDDDDEEDHWVVQLLVLPRRKFGRTGSLSHSSKYISR